MSCACIGALSHAALSVCVCVSILVYNVSTSFCLSLRPPVCQSVRRRGEYVCARRICVCTRVVAQRSLSYLPHQQDESELHSLTHSLTRCRCLCLCLAYSPVLPRCSRDLDALIEREEPARSICCCCCLLSTSYSIVIACVVILKIVFICCRHVVVAAFANGCSIECQSTYIHICLNLSLCVRVCWCVYA